MLGWWLLLIASSVSTLTLPSFGIITVTIINLSITSSITFLEITSLTIPSYSKQGENVSFHCEYTVNDSQLAELDIKWYLGSSPSPFLVFLPYLQHQPQVVDPKFRQKIVFRSVKFGSEFVMVNMSTDLSGVYTCKVSTNTEERIRRKRINIYNPADSITMEVLERAVSGEVAVSCSVSGCLPQPVLTLYTVPGSIVTHSSVYTSTNTSTVTASISLPDSAAIYCKVAVLGTNYSDTAHQYYTRYSQAVARPYTGQGARLTDNRTLAVIVFLYLCFAS